MGTEYAYAAAYARSLSNRLLSESDFSYIAGTDSSGAAEYLRTIGYFENPVRNRSELDMELKAQQKRAWDDILSVCGAGTALDIILLRNDFHNLKAAYKCAAIGASGEELMKEPSVSDPRLTAAAAKGDFSGLSEYLRRPAEEAYELFSRTGDAQQLDIFFDKEYFRCALMLADKLKSRFFSVLIKREAELVNIGIAARCLKEKRGRGFIEEAFVPPDSGAGQFLQAHDIDELCGILEKTGRAGAAAALRGGMGIFESYKESETARMYREAGRSAFGIEPVIWYIYEKNEEIKRVRQIMYKAYNRAV